MFQVEQAAAAAQLAEDALWVFFTFGIEDRVTLWVLVEEQLDDLDVEAPLALEAKTLAYNAIFPEHARATSSSPEG